LCIVRKVIGVLNPNKIYNISEGEKEERREKGERKRGRGRERGFLLHH